MAHSNFKADLTQTMFALDISALRSLFVSIPFECQESLL
jgi:hypothetical protein